jgi:hypothetical protein
MLEIRTLTDGGQSVQDVLGWIVEFVDHAERSLDFAHYDLHLGADASDRLRRAIRSAARRGVAMRFLYNLDHRNPIPVPPPPEPDGDLIALVRGPGSSDRGRAGPDASQVRRARRGEHLDRLDELDGRVVLPPGERRRDRSLARGRGAIH